VYTPAQQQSGAGAGQPEVGDFSWHELATDDWSAAWPFYQALFGWEKTSAMDMGPEMGTYQMFGREGQSVGGMFKRPPNVPAHWMPYALLKDAKAAADIVAQLGGRIVNGPMEVPGGDLIAQGFDLQGAAFAVHSRKPAAPAAVEAAPAQPKPKAKKTAAKAAKATRKAKKAKARKTVAKKTAVKKGKKARTVRKAAKKKTARAAARTSPRRAAASKKRVVKRAKKAKKAKKAARRGGAKKQARKSPRRASKKR
jgi:predicted enzyme related to lactoylglutathione lyase